MEQTLNTIIKVTTTYDVADMKANWRIVYFYKRRQIIVVSNFSNAVGIRQRNVGECIVLTKSQAPKAYPKVFTNSGIKKAIQTQHKLILTITQEQYTFLHRFGNVNAYIRSLIDRQMETTKDL